MSLQLLSAIPFLRTITKITVSHQLGRSFLQHEQLSIFFLSELSTAVPCGFCRSDIPLELRESRSVLHLLKCICNHIIIDYARLEHGRDKKVALMLLREGSQPDPLETELPTLCFSTDLLA